MFDFFFFFFPKHDRFKNKFCKVYLTLTVHFEGSFGGERVKATKKWVSSLLFSVMSRMSLCWTPHRTQD